MSDRSDIINNIITSLQGITIVGGYSIDVGQVTIEKQFQNLPEDGLFPKLIIADQQESGRARIGNNIWDFFWVIDIRCIHKGDTSRDIIDELVDDVKDVMLNDINLYRGGTAWNTEFIQTSPCYDTFINDRAYCETVVSFSIQYRQVL